MFGEGAPGEGYQEGYQPVSESQNIPEQLAPIEADPQAQGIPPPQKQPGDSELGVLIRINQKGFGFIRRDSGEEIFVHTREIKNAEDIRCITPNMKVQFTVGTNQRNPDKQEAQKVFVVDPNTGAPYEYYHAPPPPGPWGPPGGGYGGGYGYGAPPPRWGRYQPYGGPPPYGGHMGGNRRPGDWDCPNCGKMVFSSKSECFSCGTKKPAGMHDNRRPGDWDCPDCGKMVFASKSECFSCGAKKPLGLKDNRRPGDWDCPSCGKLVFGTRSECFSCGAPKPAAPNPAEDSNPPQEQTQFVNEEQQPTQTPVQMTENYDYDESAQADIKFEQNVGTLM